MYGMNQGMMQGMNQGGMSRACCPQPIAPVVGGIGGCVGVGIIAVAILILIALGLIC